MPVFNYSQITEILNTMKSVCYRTLEKSPCYLTGEQFTEAFINPDHVAKLREVHNLIGCPSASDVRHITLQTDYADADNILMTRLMFVKNPGILVPDYIRKSYYSSSDSGRMIMAWASERRKIGLLLGDAYAALNTLNDMCGNAKALSLMFPALTSLMARTNNFDGEINENSPMAKRARAISSAKSIGKLPSLPRGVIDHIRSASAMVSAMIMAEDAETVIPEDAVAVLTGTVSVTTSEHYRQPHPVLRCVEHHNFI